MSHLTPEAAARLFNQPLMISEAQAVGLLTALGASRTDHGWVLPPQVAQGVAGEMGRLTDRLGRAYDQRGLRTFEMVDNVAVITVEGTLVHKGAYLGSSYWYGETSYQGLQTQIARLEQDDEVKGVVVEVDSGGGEVAGCFETADMLWRLSQRKPTMAILTDHACSAAYLMSAPTRQIVVPPTGLVGSIGVMALHLDLTGMLEKIGAKVNLITSGERKADGHPLSPLSDPARAEIQARVDETRQLFATRVGKYRAGRLSKDQALATEAGVYAGPAAVRAGLADAVGSANDAFAAFRKAVNKA
ncbi:S49 family peptidase [Phenylobacterium sp.]|uniref:S49 family peptidase n=1 Tax=Phenylobacterium sp. TaxID=1871053 RepID=UPI00403587FF